MPPYSNSQLNQAGCDPQSEDPLMSIMRAYVQAKRAFDEACQQYANAAQIKINAEKQIHELSEKVAAVVQQGICDPTVPQVSAGYSNGMGQAPARY